MISASDALAAVTALYDVFNEVKVNKDELRSLLKRIEHIVETLNECRSRDIIRSDEYNDALSAIFDIITRTQTLAQRLLKRNPVDRAWNAGKIALEISTLNDDVQNYLSVHMVQLLDLILSSNVEHQSVLANSTEEIRVKVAELYHFLRTHIPSIKPQAQTNESFNAIYQSSTSGSQASTSVPQALTSVPQASTSGFSFNNPGAGTMNNENIGNTYYISQTKRRIKFPMKWVAADAFHNSKELYDGPKCHPHTRVAILDDIMKWVKKSDGEAQDDFIMWLFGPAGAGKSAIARTIAELAAEQDLLIGTFFFSRTSATRSTQDRLIATLAYQMALSIPDTSRDMEQAMERDPAIFKKNLETQIDTLLVKPFQSAQTKIVPSHKLIIIDGLDECKYIKAQVAILNAISSSFFPKYNLPIKFLIASRPDIDLVTSFNGNDLLKSVHRRLALDDTYRPDDDIRRFFSDKFKEIRSNHWSGSTIPTPWPTRESLKRLVEKSSGQFIFAVTVMKFVESNRHRPVARLNIIFEISPSGTMNPFAELDALYNQILSSVDDITLTLRVLSLYTAAPDLAKLLGKSAERFLSLEEGIDVALINLSSIVSYNESTGEVKILHASLVDFLSDKRRSNKFYIDMGSTRTDFACRTLQYVKGPDGIQAGNLFVFEAGLAKLRWIPNSQLRSEILDFDPDAFITAVTYRFDDSEWHRHTCVRIISSIYSTWMTTLFEAGLDKQGLGKALYRCKNSFKLRAERYQSDSRLKLLLTLALVVFMDHIDHISVISDVARCRRLDILLEMDSHDLHVVDRHALNLRHDEGFLKSFTFILTDITSVYFDGDSCASAALHCMSFLSNPPTYNYTNSPEREWMATCDMALVLLCRLLPRANTSRDLVQFLNNYDFDIAVRQKFSVIHVWQVDEFVLQFLSRANVCANWRIISAIRRALFATATVETLKCEENDVKFGMERQKITRHLTPKCEGCCAYC